MRLLKETAPAQLAKMYAEYQHRLDAYLVTPAAYRMGRLLEGGAQMKPRARRGGGRPTIADVAKLAGVGAITVSRALREPERVSESLRQQIQQAVDELGYVPDPNARALASARAEVFGVLVPSLTNNVFADVVRGIYDGLSDSSFRDPARQHALFRHGGGAAPAGLPRPASGGADRVRHRPDARRRASCSKTPAARSCRSWRPAPTRST